MLCFIPGHKKVGEAGPPKEMLQQGSTPAPETTLDYEGSARRSTLTYVRAAVHQVHQQAGAHQRSLQEHLPTVGLNSLQTHRATAWGIAGDFSNTCGTSAKHAERLENTTPRISWGWSAGEPCAAVYSCLQKQEINFSSWLSMDIDLPGQRSVCKAFYQFPGYMTGAGRKTMQFTHRKKAVSGLSWGCFTAAKLHWPQQCYHKRKEIPPWGAEYDFSQHILFSCIVLIFFFSCSHIYFPRKVLQASLWMHITLISFQLLMLSQIRSNSENNRIVLSPVWLTAHIHAIK